MFRALLPADPTHAASRLIEAVRNRGKILDDYREAVVGLGRSRRWMRMTCIGMTCSRTATRSNRRVIFQTQRGEEHPVGLDLLIMSDGTWRPDGFDTGKEGAAGDVRDYLAQWMKEQS